MECKLKSNIAPRPYQSSIAKSALEKGNTLVVLPTGLGKTLIAFLAMCDKLGKGGRAVFLAPTKPLVQQHYKSFLESVDFPAEECALISGEIPPKKRKALWGKRACFCTPQTFKNDIQSGRASPSVSLCVVDEAHRAVGNYAYTFVASECAKSGSLILGLTASPGGNRKRIEEIMLALGIRNIEIRTAEDADILPYAKPLSISYVQVPLGESLSRARELLLQMRKEISESLSAFGVKVPFHSKKALVELRQKIMGMGEKSRYAALSFYSSIFNLSHMLELIETQGPAPFLAYVKKMEGRKDSKAKRRIFSDKRFREAVEVCKSMQEHPKLAKLGEILSHCCSAGEKALVFAQYRDSVAAIVEYLRSKGLLAEKFLGKKHEITAEEQKRTIERFSRGEFPIMVATSIGEEGLDIPSVDTVVFFEPIPSEIRSIQRRGRAGRLKAGKVVVLVAEGTRDEGHLYSSRRREASMRRIVGSMKRRLLEASPLPPEALQGESKRAPKEERKGAAKAGRAPVQKKITDF